MQVVRVNKTKRLSKARRIEREGNETDREKKKDTERELNLHIDKEQELKRKRLLNVEVLKGT